MKYHHHRPPSQTSTPTVIAVHSFVYCHGKGASHHSPVQQNGQVAGVGDHKVAQEVKEDQGAMAVVARVHQTGVRHQGPHQGQDIFT